MNLASLLRHLDKNPGLRAIGKSVRPRQIGIWFTGSVLLIHPPAFSQPFTFTTIAGVPGTTGTNDGIDQGARFSFPTGVVEDNAGNLYVADFLNHAVRKLTLGGTNWVVTTIAGMPGVAGYADGTNADARFNRPAGIAMDQTGNLFVAERYNHVIRMLTPAGTDWVVSTVAGSAGVTGSSDGTNTQAQFYLPSALAIDDSNHLYVADTSNFTIREIAPIGTNWVVTTIAGTALNFGFADGMSFQAQFNYPYGIAVSSSGKLYVADSGNNAIREITHSGAEWTVATIAGFSSKPGAADGGAGFASFNFPTGIAVASGGVLYVADQSNNSIRRIVPSAPGWSVSTLAGQPQHPGSVDGTSTNALFRKPWGIAVGATGTLFVADYSNSTIREGIPTATPVPELQILMANGQVVLSWPAWATNYVLETSAVLDAANNWIPVTNGVTVTGQVLVLTNAVETEGAFYRLR